MTYNTYAPLGNCGAPVPECAGPAPLVPQPAYPHCPPPTYTDPGLMPGPTPTYVVPGQMPASPPAYVPNQTPVPMPEGAMYPGGPVSSSPMYMPHAMHTQPWDGTAYAGENFPPSMSTAVQAPQNATSPEVSAGHPVLTIPPEIQTSPPPAPPAQEAPLPKVQPGSYSMPATSGIPHSGQIRQVAAQMPAPTRWTRGQ